MAKQKGKKKAGNKAKQGAKPTAGCVHDTNINELSAYASFWFRVAERRGKLGPVHAQHSCAHLTQVLHPCLHRTASIQEREEATVFSWRGTSAAFSRSAAAAACRLAAWRRHCGQVESEEAEQGLVLCALLLSARPSAVLAAAEGPGYGAHLGLAPSADQLARSGDLSERQDPAASCARRRALTTHSQCQPRKDCVLYLNLQCPSY